MVEVKEEEIKGVVSVAPKSLINLAKVLLEARNKIDEAEAALTKANIAYDIAEKKLVDQMLTENVSAFRTANHGLFYSQVKVFPRVVDRDVLNAFVTKRKKTLGFLYTTTVNASKLGAYVRELMAASKPIPPGLDPFMKTVIRHRAK